MFVFVLLGSSVIFFLAFTSTTTKSQYQMQSGLLLDIIVAKSTTIFQLFASKDQALLVRRNTFFILNLSLDIFNSIRWLDLGGKGRWVGGLVPIKIRMWVSGDRVESLGNIGSRCTWESQKGRNNEHVVLLPMTC